MHILILPYKTLRDTGAKFLMVLIWDVQLTSVSINNQTGHTSAAPPYPAPNCIRLEIVSSFTAWHSKKYLIIRCIQVICIRRIWSLIIHLQRFPKVSSPQTTQNRIIQPKGRPSGTGSVAEARSQYLPFGILDVGILVHLLKWTWISGRQVVYEYTIGIYI